MVMTENFESDLTFPKTSVTCWLKSKRVQGFKMAVISGKDHFARVILIWISDEKITTTQSAILMQGFFEKIVIWKISILGLIIKRVLNNNHNLDVYKLHY